MIVPQIKEPYVSPESEVLPLYNEGIVCASDEVPGMEHGWDLDFNQ
jgi:hypothetical protein